MNHRLAPLLIALSLVALWVGYAAGWKWGG